MKKILKWIAVGILLLAIYFFLNSIISVFLPKDIAVKKINFEDYQNLGFVYTYVNDLEISEDDIWETIRCSGWAFVETDEPVEEKSGYLIFKGKKGSYITEKLLFSSSTIEVQLQWKKQIGSINNGFDTKFSTVPLPSDEYKIYIYVEENENAVGLVDTGVGFRKNGVRLESYTPIEECVIPHVDEMVVGFAHGWWDIYPEESNVRVQGWQILEGVNSEDLTYYVVFSGNNGKTTAYKLPHINHTSVALDYGIEHLNSGFKGNLGYDQLPDTVGIRYIVAENNGNWYRTGGTVYDIEAMLADQTEVTETIPQETAPVEAEKSGFSLTKIIAIPLIALMQKCYELLDDYILAIIVFTLLSKILLMPVALWMQRSSITMVEMMPELNRIKTKYFGDKEMISEETQILYKKRKYNPLASTVPMIVQIVLLMGVIEAVKVLLGDSDSWLLWVPAEVGGLSLLMPVAAGFAALLLTLAQNKLAPLQKEQPKAEQLSTGLVSVGISLFLGAFVSLGTGVYWIASNLISIPVQIVCNWIIKPQKYVDYEALEASRKQLEQLEGIGKKKKESYFSENKKRERADYKRFFSVVNKHLVFYSESNGFYKYYKGFIEFILTHTNLTIHYITSDPNDQIFELEKKEPQIRGYYIGENKLITLMMKMDADVVVMTMPDLENYHIKRSYIRDDIEYINVPHGMGSNNMTLRKGALDHFDTIFCAGIHQKIENEQTEAAYGLSAKTCVEVGYPLIDEMRESYAKTEHKVNIRKKILIAPSWQKDNIIDSCLEQLLDSLKKTECEIIVRPHPQEVRLKKEYMDSLKAKYEKDGIEIQTDFTSNNPVLEADLLITDWSDISWEYAFTTLRPVMYINTPMKIMNPEWQKIEYPPLNIALRDQLGKSLDVDQLEKAAETAEYLLANTDAYQEKINELAHEYVYNLGSSAEAGATYLIKAVLNQIKKKGTNKNEG